MKTVVTDVTKNRKRRRLGKDDNFFQESFDKYIKGFTELLQSANWAAAQELAEALFDTYRTGNRIYVCGNGGSAANAIHWANDFSYPISGKNCRGLKIHALSSNTATLTCIANDIEYADIYSHQISILGEPGDILIVLSGSGNSENVVRALNMAKTKEMTTFAILGFEGGTCRALADVSIYFKTNNMQYCEDIQVIVNHMIMQALRTLFNDEI